MSDVPLVSRGRTLERWGAVHAVAAAPTGVIATAMLKYYLWRKLDPERWRQLLRAWRSTSSRPSRSRRLASWVTFGLWGASRISSRLLYSVSAQ